MNLGTIRQEIAAALDTVAGVHGHTHRPAALNNGDAWPQWRGSEAAGGHSTESTWAVLIALPQTDDITADGFVDSHGAALLEALRPVIFVDTIAPAEISTDAGNFYALLITGRAE